MLSDVLLRNTSLASLNLMHNRIGDAALKPLQEMLDRNDTLMDLLVDGNPMRNDVILKVYSTSTNTQQKLKQDLRRLQAWDAELTAVDFSGQASSKSAANDLTCKLLAEALSSSHVVTSVNLNYSNVSDLGLGMLTDMLYSNTYIHTLMLDGCCITDAGVKLLAAMLLKNSTLSYISLRHNAITDDGCMALQRALVHNYTVKRLSVDHNPEVSERSFMTLGYSITLNNEPILLKQVIPQVHSNSLTVLDCSRKGVDDTLPFTDSSITLLCSVLAHSRSLTHINLKRNRIGAYGGTCLADVMLSNRTITALDLLGTEVGSGVTAFVDLLRRSSDVQHLDLRENGIEAALMSSVSLLLELNHHPPMVKHMMLQLLDGEKPDKVELTGTANGCTAIGKAQPSASEPWGGSTTTMLTSRSVGLLCDELYVNTSLTSFDFSHNYVGDAGAERVAQLVHAFPNSYVNINLAGNCIQDSGAIKLINAVMHAPAVTYFNLSDNLLKDASAYSLLHLLDKRYDLEHIHFEDNRLISPHHQKMLDVHGRLHQVHTDMRATLKQIIENGDDVRTLNMNDPDTGRLWDRQQQADDTLLEFVFSVMAEFRSHINESDFAGTRVRDQHMPTLSRILSDPDICPLSILNLADNDITDVTDMFRALKHNKCLKRLDLSRNRIPRCNGFPIVDALKGNRILDVLTLTGNPVSLSVPAYGSWGGIHRNIRDDPIWEQVYRHLTKPLGFQWYKEIHKVERWERSK
jgi:Ran GTPase-activating protein (RanGAP) involved in mRNA processing and transport